LIRRVLRDGDILFRYGRQELVVFLSNTDQSSASRIAAAMTAGISSTADKASELSGAVMAVSLGVATAPSDGMTADELISAARSRVVDAARRTDSGSIH
jgi:diguanylate cyclase (GGDEF)-like protein